MESDRAEMEVAEPWRRVEKSNKRVSQPTLRGKSAAKCSRRRHADLKPSSPGTNGWYRSP